MSSKEYKEKIWTIIKKIKVCMMITEDDGDLRGRPMHIVQEDYDGTLWFFTARDSQKVDEAQDEQNVCLVFSDVKHETYVSLSGSAHLTQNPALIEKFWNPNVAAWFPKGKNDPNVALLEIKIHKGEHWDATSSRTMQLFKVIKSNITNTPPDMGEHQKFGGLR